MTTMLGVTVSAVLPARLTMASSTTMAARQGPPSPPAGGLGLFPAQGRRRLQGSTVQVTAAAASWEVDLASALSSGSVSHVVLDRQATTN